MYAVGLSLNRTQSSAIRSLQELARTDALIRWRPVVSSLRSAARRWMWKVACAGDNREALLKACAGFIEAVDVEGDGGPGSVTTLTFSPAAAAKAGACVMRTRLVERDGVARVLRTEVLEGGKVSTQLKSHVAEVRLEAAGEGACVAKLRMEYERLRGGRGGCLRGQAQEE